MSSCLKLLSENTILLGGRVHSLLFGGNSWKFTRGHQLFDLGTHWFMTNYLIVYIEIQTGKS